MNHRQLSAFRAVIQSGGVTAAANALRVSQPAVSRLVSDLEKEVGFKLLRRKGNRSHPTKEAQLFFEEVERSFIGLQAIREAAYEIRTLSRGSIRISSSVSGSLSLLPKTVSAFHALHPNLKVSVQYDHSPRVSEWVATRQVDLGLVARPEQRSGVEHIKNYSLNCVCAIPCDHPFTDLDVVSADDLAKTSVVAMEREYMSRSEWGAELLDIIDFEKCIEIQYGYSACAHVAEGLGVAIVDPFHASFFAQLGLIRIRPLSLTIPTHIILARPKGSLPSVVCETFVNLLNAEIESAVVDLGQEILQYQPPDWNN